MSLASEILGRRLGLPRAQTRGILCDPDLPVPMDEGAVLLADRWVARTAQERPQPTVLVRSPYGRKQWVGLLFGRLLAERGLQVVIQSTRGTFGSEGNFTPFDERADGLATLRWLREQPWHADRIGLIGPSYLGIVQWAVASEAGEDLAAMTIQVSASDIHAQTYGSGSLSLESIGSWLAMVGAQESRLAPLAMARALRRLPARYSELPLADLDERATGSQLSWYREALANPDRGADYWSVRDYTAGVERVTAPVQLIGGWHDIFLPWMLQDYGVLQRAGRNPQLIVGPWAHTSPGLFRTGMREGIAWLRAHLLGDPRLLHHARVRLRLTGERSDDGTGWREFESWPPPNTGERRLWLADGGRLQDHAPARGNAAPDRYRYDPSDPTPSLGGPVLLARRPVVDNRELEARPDVLTYTADPLLQPYEAIGPVRVEIHVGASSPHFDVFARVCDVDTQGASWNVCDALTRVFPARFEQAADGTWLISFALWPIGHRFATGHRIRLQISSGAHPRYARNPGSGEDPVTATALEPVDIEIFHDAEHPSMLVLPARQRSDGSGVIRG